MKQTARRMRPIIIWILCLAVLVGVLPASRAFAEDADDSLLEIEEEADSWRYSDGRLIDDPETDGTSLLRLLSSSYSTWTEEYGAAGFGIADAATGTVTTVEVEGVMRVGIDVSKWNGDIDWDEVAAAGIDFAIIRCGYGSNFTSQDDSRFIENVQGAQEAGIQIGVYLYSYATQVTGDDSSAESEAAHVLRLLEEAGLEPDDLDLPVFLDMEDSSQTGLGADTIGDIAETFCNLISAEGYSVGIYANKSWWENYLTDEFFDTVEYRWVARYPVTTSTTSTEVEGTDIWQFTSSGTVSGISGDVDVNFDFNGRGAYGNTTTILFSDVLTASSYYYDAVYHLADAGYVSGYSDGTFGVGKTITRAEFVTILWRIACSDEAEAYDNDAQNTTGLEDVKSNRYYTAAVNWAYENGIMSGYSGGRFGVGDELTFEQLCVVIARLACGGDDALEAALTDEAAEDVLSGFSDDGDVSGYAVKGMAWCVEVELVSGNADGSLAPTEDVARERAVTVIWRAICADLL